MFITKQNLTERELACAFVSSIVRLQWHDKLQQFVRHKQQVMDICVKIQHVDDPGVASQQTLPQIDDVNLTHCDKHGSGAHSTCCR